QDAVPVQHSTADRVAALPVEVDALRPAQVVVAAVGVPVLPAGLCRKVRHLFALDDCRHGTYLLCRTGTLSAALALHAAVQGRRPKREVIALGDVLRPLGGSDVQLRGGCDVAGPL